jgi:hypothetical protein
MQMKKFLLISKKLDKNKKFYLKINFYCIRSDQIGI